MIHATQPPSEPPKGNGYNTLPVGIPIPSEPEAGKEGLKEWVKPTSLPVGETRTCFDCGWTGPYGQSRAEVFGCPACGKFRPMIHCVPFTRATPATPLAGQEGERKLAEGSRWDVLIVPHTQQSDIYEGEKFVGRFGRETAKEVAAIHNTALERDLAETRKERDALKEEIASHGSNGRNVTNWQHFKACDDLRAQLAKSKREVFAATARQDKATAELTTLREKLVEAERECAVDGPVYNQGREHECSEIRLRLREILDPDDKHGFNIDGLLLLAADLRARLATAESAIAGLREAAIELLRLADSMRIGMAGWQTAKDAMRTALASPGVAGAQGGQEQ